MKTTISIPESAPGTEDMMSLVTMNMEILPRAGDTVHLRGKSYGVTGVLFDLSPKGNTIAPEKQMPEAYVLVKPA